MIEGLLLNYWRAWLYVNVQRLCIVIVLLRSLCAIACWERGRALATAERVILACCEYLLYYSSNFFLNFATSAIGL